MAAELRAYKHGKKIRVDIPTLDGTGRAEVMEVDPGTGAVIVIAGQPLIRSDVSIIISALHSYGMSDVADRVIMWRRNVGL